jgi:hypothetical protein
MFDTFARSTADPDDAADAHGHAECQADLTERLFLEFEHALPLHTIAGVVRDCRSDLAGAPVGALPELTERLARQRLSAAVALAEPVTISPIGIETAAGQSGTATVSLPVSMS